MKRLIFILILFILLSSIASAGVFQEFKHTITEKKILKIKSPTLKEMTQPPKEPANFTVKTVTNKIKEPILLVHGHQPQLYKITEKRESLFKKLFDYFLEKLKTQQFQK